MGRKLVLYDNESSKICLPWVYLGEASKIMPPAKVFHGTLNVTTISLLKTVLGLLNRAIYSHPKCLTQACIAPFGDLLNHGSSPIGFYLSQTHSIPKLRMMVKATQIATLPQNA